jgi:hypothetical protein
LCQQVICPSDCICVQPADWDTESSWSRNQWMERNWTWKLLLWNDFSIGGTKLTEIFFMPLLLSTSCSIWTHVLTHTTTHAHTHSDTRSSAQARSTLIRRGSTWLRGIQSHPDFERDGHVTPPRGWEVSKVIQASNVMGTSHLTFVAYPPVRQRKLLLRTYNSQWGTCVKMAAGTYPTGSAHPYPSGNSHPTGNPYPIAYPKIS